MSLPIPSGYNFKVTHKKRDNHYSMPSATVHGDFYGIGYMYSGDRMIITPAKTVIVHPGTVQFMHKNLYHRTTYISDGIYENIDIKFRESTAEYIISIIGKENFDMLFDQISITITPEANRQIRQIATAMEQEWNHYDNYSEDVIKGLILQFFVITLRGRSISHDFNVILKPKHLPLIDALHYIQHHYVENPSLKQTAEAVHISSAYLSRLFKAELNTSYSRFLTEIRLTHAMKLLQNTNLPISEIAVQCGYSNSNYFCDAFKNIMGMSPLKFRKRGTFISEKW